VPRTSPGGQPLPPAQHRTEISCARKKQAQAYTTGPESQKRQRTPAAVQKKSNERGGPCLKGTRPGQNRTATESQPTRTQPEKACGGGGAKPVGPGLMKTILRETNVRTSSGRPNPIRISNYVATLLGGGKNPVTRRIASASARTKKLSRKRR